MKFRLPPNMSAVSVEGHEFIPDADGVVDATGFSGATMRGLMLMKAEPIGAVPADLDSVQASAALRGDVWRGVMRFRAPPGVSCVSAGGAEYQVDADGIIAVEDCSHEIAEKLIAHCQCRPVAALEVQQRENLREDREASKNTLRSRLRAAGIIFDGRATLDFLRNLALENDIPIDEAGTAPPVSNAA